MTDHIIALDDVAKGVLSTMRSAASRSDGAGVREPPSVDVRQDGAPDKQTHSDGFIDLFSAMALSPRSRPGRATIVVEATMRTGTSRCAAWPAHWPDASCVGGGS
jgi:hypothetical protein